MISSQDVPARGIRFAVTKDGKEAGHAFLYILYNNLHAQPFGLLEDVAVSQKHRGSGLGNELVNAVITAVQSEGCYKLLATSRNDGTRKSVHDWYERLGFKDYGTEFRLDF